MRDRVYFFSPNDLSVGFNLELAEKKIKEIESGKIPLDLDGIIELWHIRKLIESDCRLAKWSNDDFLEIKNITKL